MTASNIKDPKRSGEQIKVAEADWLGCRPIFYNLQERKWSTQVSDVFRYEDVEFDLEGLKYYLQCGFSVFGKTPVKNVQFLLPGESLLQSADGALAIERDDKSVLHSLLGPRSLESQVIDHMRESVRGWEQTVTDDMILLPLSGGLDSRMLGSFLASPERVRAFTYGLSSRQEESFEVVRAQQVARMLGLRWLNVDLGGFHEFIDEWNEMYNVSTHAHGMYQMEFYGKIKALGVSNCAMLSGIVGDAWAGSLPIHEISVPESVLKLSRSHGMCCQADIMVKTTTSSRLEEFFEENRLYLADPRWQTLTTVRMKMILLYYLIRVPEQVGFRPWSPFLQQDVALGMLNLPHHRRENRIWQRDYVEKCGLGEDIDNLPCSMENNLNLQAQHRHPFAPLSVDLLREIVDARYVEYVNHKIKQKTSWRLRAFYVATRFGRCKHRYNNQLRQINSEAWSAYCGYVVLYPLQKLIESRNAARNREST